MTVALAGRLAWFRQKWRISTRKLLVPVSASLKQWRRWWWWWWWWWCGTLHSTEPTSPSRFGYEIFERPSYCVSWEQSHANRQHYALYKFIYLPAFTYLKSMVFWTSCDRSAVSCRKIKLSWPLTHKVPVVLCVTVSRSASDCLEKLVSECPMMWRVGSLVSLT